MADAETTRDVAVMTDADAFAATTAAVVTTDAAVNAATIVADTTMNEEENGKTDGKENGKTVMTVIGTTAVDAEMNSHQDRCLLRRQDLQDLRLRIADVIRKDAVTPAGNRQSAWQQIYSLSAQVLSFPIQEVHQNRSRQHDRISIAQKCGRA